MEDNLKKIIVFASFDTKNGVLTMYEHGTKPANVPFEPKRVLVMQGMKGGDKRGGHTHDKTRQVLVCVRGKCLVHMDNGSQKIDVTLDKPHEGVLLEPYVWHTMSDFGENTVLLVLADT